MTSQPLTEQQLADIQARADAATPGPWLLHDDWPGRVFSESQFNHHVARVTGSNPEPNERFIANAREDVPALLAEIQRLTDRVAELEKAAVNARDALGSLCYDLEDPGTAALGALYLLAQATTWTETGPDFAVEALAQHSAKVLHGVADIADPEPPEVSFFGDHGPAVANWLRMLASRKPLTEEAGQ